MKLTGLKTIFIMTTESTVPQKHQLSFVQKLSNILTGYRPVFTSVLFFILILSGGYSLFFPCYVSNATLQLRQHDDPTSLPSTIVDIPSNENFLSTQMTLLMSRPVLKRTLNSCFPELKINNTIIKKIETSILLKRLPLNNIVELKLKWNSEKTTRKLLSAYIESYITWRRESLKEDAMHIVSFIKSELELQKTELDKAEMILENFLQGVPGELKDSEQQMTKLEAQYSYLFKRFGEISDALDRLEKKKIEILRLIEDQIGLKYNEQALPEEIKSLKAQLHLSIVNRLRAERIGNSDTSTDKKRQAEIKYLEDEFKRLMVKLVLGNGGKKNYDSTTPESKFIQHELDMISVESTLNYIKDQIKKNREKSREFAFINAKRKRLEKNVGVKESYYMDLLFKLEKCQSSFSEFNTLGIKIISNPTNPIKQNKFLKMQLIGLFTGLILNTLIVYFLMGRETCKIE